MRFKRKICYFLCLLVLFSQIVSLGVERIDFRSAILPVNDVEKGGYCANAALEKAGILERITNEPFNEGSYGRVFYTPNYAVKISRAEYHYGLNNLDNTESTRLINIKNQIQVNPPLGVKLCLPEHVYKVYVDGMNYQKFTNIQVMPRIHAQGTMGSILDSCIKNQDAQSMTLMRCFGEKMGQFQNWGLVQKLDSIPDRTCMHGDLNPSNILVTNKNAEGTSADFIFIDNADYSNPQVIGDGGGSLVSDVTRLTYSYTYKIRRMRGCNWKSGLSQTMENFYKGYIPQFPVEVSQKLMINLYGNPHECLAQTKRDIKYHILGKEEILAIQSRAFQAAYRAVYPPEILPWSSPVAV